MPKIEFLDKKRAIFRGRIRKIGAVTYSVTIPKIVFEALNLQNGEEIKLTIEKTTNGV